MSLVILDFERNLVPTAVLHNVRLDADFIIVDRFISNGIEQVRLDLFISQPSRKPTFLQNGVTGMTGAAMQITLAIKQMQYKEWQLMSAYVPPATEYAVGVNLLDMVINKGKPSTV